MPKRNERDDLLNLARRGDRDAFHRLAESHRRELQLHCYRMLGSIHDAEDAVQDTLLRAWCGLEAFEGRASFRNWLYRIATNACLNALAARKKARLLPQDIGPPAQTLPQDPAREIAWLEPYPDELLVDLDSMTPGPEARYELHEAVQLAFVAAVQHLPPRQRAVLLLRDVLGWPAAEAAQLLDTSVASITSALQRARATLEAHYGSNERLTSRVSDERNRALLDRYIETWEAADLDGFVALLREDAVLSMPPYREWYAGRDAIRGFFASAWTRYGGRSSFRLLETAANRQPAFALYALRPDEDRYLAHSIQILTVRSDGIAALTNFKDAQLFAAFGLPRVLANEGRQPP